MENFKEKNRDTLQSSLRNLPKLEAPPQLWNELSNQLGEEEKLQAKLKELPVYTPPARVWDQLVSSLDREQANASILRRLPGNRRWMAAAAMVGLLFGVWWFYPTEAATITTLAYGEEVLTAPALIWDWQDEDDVFAQVLSQAKDSPIAEPKTLNRLQNEYNELLEARSEIENMMQRYGKDENLMKEVARIERERSKVIKQLAVWI